MDENKKEDQKEERLPAVLRAEMLQGQESLFFNVALWEHGQRVAQMLASSTMIPDHFQKNIGNCLIALNLAQRLNIDVLMLMQNCYIVHGRPGFQAQLLIALIQNCGRFGPLDYRMARDNSGKIKSCLAYATDLKSGKVLEGPTVTAEMVSGEGWDKPKGNMVSKWLTMPEVMYKYRAATFFTRIFSPGTLMGLRTVEEIEDIGDRPEIKVREIQRADLQDADLKGNAELARKLLLEAAPANAKEQPTLFAYFETFLEMTAGGLRKTIDETAIEASEDAKEFWRAFSKWFKKTKKDEEGGETGATAGATAGAAGSAEVSGKKEEEGKLPSGKPPQTIEYLKELLKKYQKEPKAYYTALGEVNLGEVLDNETAKKVIDKMDEILTRK